ncbi:extracellular catalytic domain type 1 short-chain-length polyhydroxyalkanoate depolymerase [Variovorax sp. JS1663]|uniref:extracellular catalytic domain type 1 short-chain-length polyhydroxyalkanoate depolymerase n=1 Tax=Variovorax sp. JS1663 TaxID=1851577 RepID=UPI000B3477B0|nr:PHB depolymerase family esterase [Variovorax sp. JS1663]OUM02214.1 phospholipase [Variovorax sp. JS1663]
MAKRKKATWTGIFARSVSALSRIGLHVNAQVVDGVVKSAIDKRRPPAGAGQWISGVAMGAAGMRRFRLYRPPGVKLGERLPLMVMLHGCLQDAKSFATSTRMNGIAARERFLVLYPEQDRVSNAQGCWNWFDTSAGRAYGEVALIMKAIDQVCLMYPVDRTRVAVAGLSAGASMAALLVSRHPERFRAVVMHSGIPPGTAHSTLSAMGAMVGQRSTKPLVATPAALAGAWPPLMVIHGGLDRVVASSNGQAAVQAWADAAGATAVKQRSVQRGSRYPTRITEFKRRGSTVAKLVEIARLGHAWSGGAAKQPYSDERGPDASRMAWVFAAKQFRAR